MLARPITSGSTAQKIESRRAIRSAPTAYAFSVTSRFQNAPTGKETSIDTPFAPEFHQKPILTC